MMYLTYFTPDGIPLGESEAVINSLADLLQQLVYHGGWELVTQCSGWALLKNADASQRLMLSNSPLAGNVA